MTRTTNHPWTHAGKGRLLLLLACLTTAPAALGASFDCTKATTPVEQLICGEWLLERLDERMATLYERAATADGADLDALLAAQRAWIERRDACTQTDCIEQAYRARIAELGGGAEGNTGQLTRELVQGGDAVLLSDTRGDLDIQVIFPRLVRDDAVAQAINRTIEQAFRDPAEGFDAQYQEFLAEEDGIHLGPSWAFSLGYQKIYALERIIAIDAGGYMYTGGAHGGALYLPLAVDRSTGKLLEPENLFRPDSAWLKLLADHSRAALAKREPFSTDSELVSDDWFLRGTAPTEENYGLLLPTDAGIQVSFTQYQVGPYAIGDFKVIVPYAELREVLNPDLFPSPEGEAESDAQPDQPTPSQQP